MLHGFNQEQYYGYTVMMSGVNCFVSGDAGTGKSYLLDKFINDSKDAGKNVAVIAPTGIAALNINGITAHRMFKLGIRPCIFNAEDVKPIKELLEIDTLVLDEVSMCRVDLFDYMITSIGKANKIRLQQGLNVIQIILCGDFFQLPPVIADRDKDVLNEHYGYDIGKGFAFQSQYWNKLGLVNIVLRQIVRQQDVEFATILNKTRLGLTSCIRDIQLKSCKYSLDNAIYVLGTNKAVKEKNNAELRKIDSPEHVYEAICEGDVKDSDKMTDDLLVLKVGARVMTLTNHSAGLYQNGSLGTVVACTEEYVKVYLDVGYSVNIHFYEWEILSYSLKPDKNKKRLSADVAGTFTQIPLKLAYAVTVHKSQGQTYDAVNLDPYAWDCGQLYVALSRVRDISKLYLTQPILSKYLVTSNEVRDFYNNL